jgi:hypothetical protein
MGWRRGSWARREDERQIPPCDDQRNVFFSFSKIRPNTFLSIRRLECFAPFFPTRLTWVWADTPSNRPLRVVAFVEYKATSTGKQFSPGPEEEDFFSGFSFRQNQNHQRAQENERKMFFEREKRAKVKLQSGFMAARFFVSGRNSGIRIRVFDGFELFCCALCVVCVRLLRARERDTLFGSREMLKRELHSLGGRRGC